MILSKLIKILQHFETCYPNAKVQLTLDSCESPEEIFIEVDNPKGNVIIITQGNCGL